ncbi:MAG: winged helix-turn-helix transcriptional regulator [Chloroflexi bacterium]|nr:winged helix-turn-helix transcriptional regulator [Chloroflexota bacterium]
MGTYQGQEKDTMLPGSGELSVDSPERRLWPQDVIGSLTRTERDVLTCLSRRAGRVVSRSTLAEMVQVQGGRNVDVVICRLRHKLNDQQGNYIKTIRKVGYRLNLGTEGPEAVSTTDAKPTS